MGSQRVGRVQKELNAKGWILESSKRAQVRRSKAKARLEG